MLKKLAAVFAAVLVLSVSASAGTVVAQDRTVTWQRWDVTIDNVNTTRNQFDVTESYDVRFDGQFTFGSVVIPTDRLDSIGSIQVTEEGQTLQGNCSQRAGTYCATNTPDGLSIT